MSLYNKYRPTEFKDIVGNIPTVAALESFLAAQDRSHSLLFTGGSGQGKTTLARIVAHKLGCLPHDLIELNSANFRGVDTSRDIIQQMRLKPLSGPVKIWILDECHKMTGEGQNALLKALEDTPSHVYFILASTDPQKLLKTIINRCIEFKVQPLPENRIMFLLNKICEKEGKKINENVLEKIAKDCQGSARKALTALEGVIDLDPEQQLRAAEQTTKEESEVIELCRALVQRRKWFDVSKILKGIQDTEAEQVRHAVLAYCNKVLLSKEDNYVFLVMESFKESFYYTGHAGLTLACYQACHLEDLVDIPVTLNKINKI